MCHEQTFLFPVTLSFRLKFLRNKNGLSVITLKLFPLIFFVRFMEAITPLYNQTKMLSTKECNNKTTNKLRQTEKILSKRKFRNFKNNVEIFPAPFSV